MALQNEDSPYHLIRQRHFGRSRSTKVRRVWGKIAALIDILSFKSVWCVLSVVLTQVQDQKMESWCDISIGNRLLGMIGKEDIEPISFKIGRSVVVNLHN